MRIVLADDSVLLREGLARLLSEAGLTVVGQAGDAGQLLAADRRSGGRVDILARTVALSVVVGVSLALLGAGSRAGRPWLPLRRPPSASDRTVWHAPLGGACDAWLRMGLGRNRC